MKDFGFGGCRGTFLGAPWGPFSDVKKVWAEFFASKPYAANALGIAGDQEPPDLSSEFSESSATGNMHLQSQEEASCFWGSLVSQRGQR